MITLSNQLFGDFFPDFCSFDVIIGSRSTR
jgi:hypothetical protein